MRTGTTHRGFSVVFKKTMGVTIIGTLILAPLPPFSNPEFSEKTRTAKEIYQSSNSVPEPVAVRYRAGDPAPQFLPSNDISVSAFEPASLLAGISLDQTLPTTEGEEVDLSQTRNVRAYRAQVPETVIAAEQVALGLAASEIVEVALDANANIVETVDTHGAKTTAEYNDAGDPVKIVSPDGTRTYYAYDSDGNLTGIYNEQPVTVTAFSWRKPFSSIIAFFTSSARALAGVGTAHNTAIAYQDGNVTAVKDRVGVVDYQYDDYGNLEAETNTGGEYTVYEYDEFGNVVGKEIVTPATSEAVSSVTRLLARFHLGGLSRFIARAYADQEKVAQEESFGYDDRNNLEAFAVSIAGIAPVATTNEAEVVTPPSPLQPALAETAVIESSASSTPESPVTPTEASPAPVLVPEESLSTPVEVIQQVVSVFTKPVRSLLAWAAPFMARAVAQEVPEISPEPSMPITGESIVVWHTRDALDNIIETENQKGEVTTYRYDSRTDALIGKTLTSAQRTVLSTIDYGFDSTHNRWTSRTENGVTESYSYDVRGQLTQGSGAYTYDERGNRVQSQDARGSYTYTYEGNRLLSAVGPETTKSYEYDSNGNVVAIRDSNKGLMTLSYTSRGAIESIGLPSGTHIRYTYDALNRRVEKSMDGRIERYQYEGKNLTRVLDVNGNVLRQYVYDPKGALIAIVKDRAVYTVILDAKGSVTGLTNERSEVVARFSYDAWGTPQSTDTSLTDFYFASGYYEAEAGLYILGPRTYDPTLGRFLQKDPLAGSLLDVVSQNEYVYANNDPVNKIDPTGHRAEEVSVGDSPKAIAASARSGARQMKAVITETTEEIASLEAQALTTTDPSALQDLELQLIKARAALVAAREAREAMLELARSNEQDIAEREAEALLEAAADAAWQASLESQPPPVSGATTSPQLVPSEEGTTPADSSEATTTPETVTVPTADASAPAVESSAEVPAQEALPQNPAPPATVEDTEPANALSIASAFATESLYKLLPKVEAKRKKSKSKKKPPPPKKKKEVKEKAPKKLSKAESRKAERARKQERAVKNLRSTSRVQSASASVAASRTRRSTPVPSTANMAQATKRQMSTLAVAPVVATTKTQAASKLTSAPASAKVQHMSLSLHQSVNAQLEQVAKGIAEARARQAAESARAAARAVQLIANGNAKVTPVVNSPAVKRAQHGLALCSFEPTIVGGTCGLVDGFLYGLQGNGTSAGLSFMGALPIGGLAFDAAKSGRLAEEGAKIGKVTMTQWGWSGSAVWKGLVTTVSKGGTIETLAGRIPTKMEAVNLITEGAGKIDRIEGPHLIPNPHVYNHINYTTQSGQKGTIQIQDL